MNSVQPPAPAPAARKSRRLVVLAVAILALAALIYALVLINNAPRTDDAYAQADTIGVAAQVAGRIVELKARDNASVRKGDVLFVIDPIPYTLDVDRLHAQLATLEQQIILTQRQVDAQKHAASASGASVARAADNMAQKRSTLQRLEPLLADEYVSKEQVDQARTASKAASQDLAAARYDHQPWWRRKPSWRRRSRVRTTSCSRLSCARRSTDASSTSRSPWVNTPLRAGPCLR
jgi:multidrug efflux system membrane fusion protein